MTVGSILVALAVLVLVAPLVAAPLRSPLPRRASRRLPGEALPVSLLALRDLDFDYQTGKVSAEDYTDLRRSLMAQAAVAAAAPPTASAQALPLPPGETTEASELGSGRTCHVCHARVRPGDRYCSTCGHPASLPCPGCGAHVEQGDRFCQACGAGLALEV